MGDTKIEYVSKSWSPIRGCSKVSAGCKNCWAVRMANRQKSMPGYEGFVDEHGWTGKVELIESQIDAPLHWRKPQRVATAFMGDLFHPALSDEDRMRVIQVIEKCPQHTFLLLTKRAKEMCDFFSCEREYGDEWPRNIWLGVSVENQAAADERIPWLLRTPAAVRWISAEPLLGPLNLRKYLKGLCPQCHGFDDYCADVALCETCGGLNGIGLNWVVLGGESGPGARPMHPDWARSVRDQCVAASVPFWFKQWGEFCPLPRPFSYHRDGTEVKNNSGYRRALSRYAKECGATQIISPGQLAEGILSECVQYGETAIGRGGMLAAGNLLDGRTWAEFPDVKAEGR